eukprot:SAG22_NODE_109_length_19706_cov_464.723772_6_plen_88_part_00
MAEAVYRELRARGTTVSSKAPSFCCASTVFLYLRQRLSVLFRSTQVVTFTRAFADPEVAALHGQQLHLGEPTAARWRLGDPHYHEVD